MEHDLHNNKKAPHHAGPFVIQGLDGEDQGFFLGIRRGFLG